MNIKKIIREAIEEAVNEMLSEYRYEDSTTPLNSKAARSRYLGRNPLTVDNGGHASNDVVGQPSTVDYNGSNFRTNDKVVLSDNKFIIYKIKNFGNDRITSTLDLFGRGVSGEKSLRREIDTLNGAARRNGRHLMYRTITSVSNEKRSDMTGGMSNTFWEFSMDGGGTWYIMKPNGTQNMKPSKLIRKQ